MRLRSRALLAFTLLVGGLWSAQLVFAAAVPAPAAAADGSAQEQADNAATVAAAKNLPPDEYYRGKILALDQEGTRDVAGETEHYKVFRVRITSGKETGQEHAIEVNDLDVAGRNRAFNVGDAVAVVKSYGLDLTPTYYIADNYRNTPLIFMTICFFALAVVFGRKRGFTSIFGLASTVAVIIFFVIPRIAAGSNPLVVCLIGAVAVAALSLYLAHGFNRRTTIALASTLLTLAVSTWIAMSWVSWGHLFGLGSEDALFLQGTALGNIDLRGLLLGGIILGVLGILDDITTAQAAIVEELKSANPSLKFDELYRRAISVGKEHIASLINTLFLAYAGASLPLFLLFEVNKNQPLWFIVNSESISEEIVRTLVGSVCLILAVPITTALAASFYSDRAVAPSGDQSHGGHHH